MSNNRIAATSPDFNAAGSGPFAAMDPAFGASAITVAGAIAVKEGAIFINGTGALALTLALPIAGLPSAGGDDGRMLVINSVSAFAHTVTTPATGLNGTLHILTYGGAVTDSIELIAFNGSWRSVGTPRGVTVS